MGVANFTSSVRSKTHNQIMTDVSIMEASCLLILEVFLLVSRYIHLLGLP